VEELGEKTMQAFCQDFSVFLVSHRHTKYRLEAFTEETEEDKKSVFLGTFSKSHAKYFLG
jgi:hypothetical protein